MARHTTGPLIKFGALPQIALPFGPQKAAKGQPTRARAPPQDRSQPGDAASTRARAAPTPQMGSLEQAIDSDDVHRHVLKFLDGKACRTASEAVVRWRKLQNEGWWRAKARNDLSVGFWPADQEEDWLAVYKRCHRPPSLLKWVAGPLRSHCLGDRVAAPQMFA